MYFECGSHYNKTKFATVMECSRETTLKLIWRPPPKWTPWTLPQRLEAPQLRPGQWQVKVYVILQISTKQHLRWKEYKLMSALFTLSEPGWEKIRKLSLRVFWQPDKLCPDHGSVDTVHENIPLVQASVAMQIKPKQSSPLAIDIKLRIQLPGISGNCSQLLKVTLRRDELTWRAWSWNAKERE